MMLTLEEKERSYVTCPNFGNRCDTNTVHSFEFYFVDALQDIVCTLAVFLQNPMKKGGVTSRSNLSKGLTKFTNQPSVSKHIRGSMVF